MIACHVLSLHILHFCRHCLRQKYFRKYSMWVKLPATLNIQLEYAFYTWWKVCTKFVGTIIFLSPSNYYSLDAQCCNNDCCECLLARPRDVNLSQNGDPRVGKLTFENWTCQISRGLPLPPPPHPTPILGQTIDRCINMFSAKNPSCNKLNLIIPTRLD